MVHPGTGIGDSYIEKVEHFPKVEIRARPVWLTEVDQPLQENLAEAYRAYDDGLLGAAAMSMRAAIDMVLVSLVGDQGGFKRKLAIAQEKRIMTPDEAEILDAAIESGSASTHRGHRQTEETICDLFDISEHIIERIYVSRQRKDELVEKARRLKESTPPRGRA